MSIKGEIRRLAEKVRRYDDGSEDGVIIIVPTTPDMTDAEREAAFDEAAKRYESSRRTVLLLPDNGRDDEVITMYPEDTR